MSPFSYYYIYCTLTEWCVEHSLSFLRLYYDPNKKFVFPYLTAIIDVRDGIVQGIAWDNACVFCSSENCLENTFNFNGELTPDLAGQSKGCYLTKATCNSLKEAKDATTGTTCDVQLFVVWTGTDDQGNVFSSSGNRFSAFPPGRIQDRINALIPDINLPNFTDFT